jgi:hypothetical protein
MHPHHYRFLVGSIIGLLIGGAVAGAAFWAYEYFWARFKPTLLTKDASQVQRLLDEGDWVSPGRKGPAVYMLTYRDCDACGAYERQEFPKLAAADVDTRVLAFVRPDVSGQSLSTPSERSTVAELWINRDWGLYDRWTSTPEDAWAPQGLRSADGDWARTAVVSATHAYVDRVMALLRENGLTGEDPILIWRDKRGRLKACACTDPLSYHFVRSDFGAPDKAPPPAPATAPASGSAPASGAPAASAPAAAPTPAAPAPSAASNPLPDQGSPPAQPGSSTPPATSGAAPAATKMNNKAPARALSTTNSTFH